jgi:hypothetical protein
LLADHRAKLAPGELRFVSIPTRVRELRAGSNRVQPKSALLQAHPAGRSLHDVCIYPVDTQLQKGFILFSGFRKVNRRIVCSVVFEAIVPAA